MKKFNCIIGVVAAFSCVSLILSGKVDANRLSDVRCKSNEFLCAAEGKCIHEAWYCDGDPDCQDRSDEIDCEEQGQLPVPLVSKYGAGNTLKDPPGTPSAYVTLATANTILLHWTVDDDGGSPITGYTIHYKAETDNLWEEIKLGRSEIQYRLTGLRCATRYQMYVIAINRVGAGPPTLMITARTSGTAPVAPPQNRLFTVHSTSFAVNVDTFEDGGCGNLNLVVEYKRPSYDLSWRVVTENAHSQSDPIVVHGLIPGTRYDVRVTGRTVAGSTVGSYSVATLPLSPALTSQNAIRDGPCASDQFECRESGRCISKLRVCDGRRHCRDGSDEQNCGNSTSVPSRSRSLFSSVGYVKCKTDEFMCVRDNKCIPEAWVCDGDSDCTDHADETSCESGTQQRRESPNPHKYHTHQTAGTSVVTPRTTTTTTTTTPAPTQRPQMWYPVAAPLQQSDSECPSPCGVFEVANNCQQYIVCNFGKARRLTCPSGLLFDRSLSTCNFDYQVHCPVASYVPPPERIMGLERDWV